MDSSSSSFKKMVFMGGKGGVGKTTMSAALAIALSKKGKSILISTDPAHSLSHILEISPSKEITQIEDSLALWELNAPYEYEKFMQRHEDDFKTILDTSTYLDEEDINQFLGMAIPGIDELMGFKSIIDLVNRNEYEYYIIDTAPTGHALRLLLIPEILNEWIKQIASLRWKYRQVQKAFAGKYTPDEGDDMLLELKKSVLKMRKILSESDLSEFIIVCKPEKMVYEETASLRNHLLQHGISINNMIINNVMDSPDESAFCSQVASYQKEWIDRYETEFQEINRVSIPMYPYPLAGINDLERLSASLSTITI